MTKTARMITADIKNVDCVIEIVDARCPISSSNPMLPTLTKGKASILVMNKCDLADAEATKRHKARYEQEGRRVMCVSAVKAVDAKVLVDTVRIMLASKIERDRARMMINRPLRVMVCGIPNVGKSTFINSLIRRGATQTADRPGVTRGKQWISLKGGIDVLDTPGILWPKFEDERAAQRLAFIGAIKDDVLDIEELCALLLEHLAQNYARNLEERYSIKVAETDGGKLLEAIAKRRGFIVKGGETDTQRAAAVVLDEFRAAKLGRITFE